MPSQSSPDEIDGDLVRHLRLDLGLTQAELAKHCQLSRSQISRAERGSMPHPATLKKLATGLGTTPSSLLSAQGRASP